MEEGEGSIEPESEHRADERKKRHGDDAPLPECLENELWLAMMPEEDAQNEENIHFDNHAASHEHLLHISHVALLPCIQGQLDTGFHSRKIRHDLLVGLPRIGPQIFFHAI